MEAVQARPWTADRESIRGAHDFYLLADRPEMTDLHRAAALGDLAWLEEGLAAGLDVNTPDKHGATPIHWAAMTGRPDVCQRLISAGADLEFRDYDGANVIDYAKLSEEYTSKAQARELTRMLEAALRMTR
jgi:ankyrin repeat protein